MKGGTDVTKLTPREREVLHALLVRRNNYSLTYIEHSTGKYYDVVLQGSRYTAVVLYSSFEYYQKRYHLADIQPTLCVCMVHDTVLPIDCLSLQASNFAKAMELPERIDGIGANRKSRTGSRVLLGQYILGVHSAVDLVEDLPDSTRKRYMAKARQLRARLIGKPVGCMKKVASPEQ